MDEQQQIFELKQRVAKLERAVEFLLKQTGVDYKDEPPPISPDIMDLLAQGNTIEAIKAYRQQTGAGLAEAKNYIDSLLGH